MGEEVFPFFAARNQPFVSDLFERRFIPCECSKKPKALTMKKEINLKGQIWYSEAV